MMGATTGLHSENARRQFAHIISQQVSPGSPAYYNGERGGSGNLNRVDIVMSPGSRIFTPDRSPVFRFVEAGKIKWSALPPSSPEADSPKLLFNAIRHDWIGWMTPGKAVLVNAADQAAEYIEFSVVPAPDLTP